MRITHCKAPCAVYQVCKYTTSGNEYALCLIRGKRVAKVAGYRALRSGDRRRYWMPADLSAVEAELIESGYTPADIWAALATRGTRAHQVRLTNGYSRGVYFGANTPGRVLFCVTHNGAHKYVRAATRAAAIAAACADSCGWRDSYR